jgi:hypothetical protein
MKLTTTTQDHLSHGTEIHCEAGEYLDLATYGTITARSASGCSITVKTDAAKLADAVVDYVTGSRYCSDPDRAQILLGMFDRLENAITAARENLASKV